MTTVASVPLASVLSYFQTRHVVPGSENPPTSVSWASDGNAGTYVDLAYDGTTIFTSGAILYDLANHGALSSGQAIGYVYVDTGNGARLAASEIFIKLANTNTSTQDTLKWFRTDGGNNTYYLAPPGRANGSDWRTDINALQIEITGNRATSDNGTAQGIYRGSELTLTTVTYNRPSVNVTAPAEGSTVTTTARPTISWSFTGDTLSQSYYRVRIFTNAQYTAGGFVAETSAATVDSGWVASSATSYQPPSNLTNGTQYRAYVQVAQTLPYSNFIHYSVDGTTLAALGATQYKTFTISLAAPPAPTAIAPTSGSTVTTDIPTLQATLGASTVVGALVRAEWQLATDAGFTTNVRTLLQATNEQVTSGVVSKALSAGSSELFQGTWYIRARELDSNGLYGAYSASHSFTVAHAPAMATLGPVSQISRPTGTVNFSFNFSDPSPTDFQTGFQILIERDSDSLSIYDSGTQASSANNFDVAIPNTNEVQTIGLGAATAGTITITFAGQTTAAIAYNANAAAIQAALEALSNVDPGDIVVTGGPFPATATLTFSGANYSGQNVAQITAAGTGLTGGTITIATTTEGGYNNTLLKWRVRGRDSDNVFGAYSANAQFYTRPRPTIVPVVPTAAQVINQPSPTYSFTILGSAARTINQYRFVTKLAGTIVDDSGWKTGATATHTPAVQLVNNTGYTVDLEVLDNLGLDNLSTVSFTTSWTPPASPGPPTVDTSLYDVTGRLRVNWNENRDGSYYSYRVYYKKTSETVFRLLGETTVNTGSTYSFDDYSVPANVEGQIVVTQVAYRFGETVESSTATNQLTITPVSTHYFLASDDPALTVRLSRVNTDAFTDEWEQSEIQLIGRGRRVERGARWGVRGTLSGRLYDDATVTAAQQRVVLETLRDQKLTCRLRTPFGDSWLVVMGDLELSRVPGVGVNAYYDFSVPYIEVLE